MMFKKALSLLLALMLIVASVPLSAVSVSADDGDTLTVTAKSNIAPSYTQSFDPDTEQITVTWWIQSEETMIGAQWRIKYDNTVLKMDQTSGVNMTFNDNGSVKKNMIFRATDGVCTVTNMAPKSLAGSGITCNAYNDPTGYQLVAIDGESRIPFISVTFNPLEGVKGETIVELDVQAMLTKGPGDVREDYFINDSVIVDDTITYLPDSPVAVYAGPIDPDYVPEQPATFAPTEIPVEYPTEESTQASVSNSLTVHTTSNFFRDNPSKTWADDDVPSQVTVEYYIDTPDKYQAIMGLFYMYYDPTILRFSEENNSREINYRIKTTVMPIASSVVCTYDWKENGATFNFSDAIPGDYLTDEDGKPIPVVRLIFDVVGEGDATVNLDVYRLILKDFETETDPDTWYEFCPSTYSRSEAIRQLVAENADVYTAILPDSTVIPTQPPTEEPTEPYTEPVTEPCTEPITEPCTEPCTEPITEPCTEPCTEPITEPYTEPYTQPYTEPFEKQLVRLNITKMPDKTSYVYGETLDLSGMQVMAVYSDYSVETVTDYDVTPLQNTIGTQTVTLTYEGKTASFNVWVGKGELTDLILENAPNKRHYRTGEALDLTGMILVAEYDSGYTEYVTDCEAEANLNEEGYTVPVTLTYGGKSVSYTVRVTAPVLLGINISKTPDKIQYLPGEAFDKTGMTVTAFYNDGTERQVTDYTVSPMDAQGGVQQLTVSWQDKTATLTVVVYPLGDVNKDGIITIADVTLLQKALVDLVTLDDSERQLADFNRDGEISIADATLIQMNISQ